jgi:hypothetical protein
MQTGMGNNIRTDYGQVAVVGPGRPKHCSPAMKIVTAQEKHKILFKYRTLFHMTQPFCEKQTHWYLFENIF